MGSYPPGHKLKKEEQLAPKWGAKAPANFEFWGRAAVSSRRTGRVSPQGYGKMATERSCVEGPAAVQIGQDGDRASERGASRERGTATVRIGPGKMKG